MPKAIYPNSRVQNHGFKNKMLARTSQKTQRGTRDTRSRDFKRGIDTKTKRTPFSGGTGVLPEKILQAKDVRTVGLGLLVAGASVGAYFVATSGFTIAVLLGFAIVSIYFYSTRIVDSGLAEVFVAVKGTMIVLGSAFIRASTLA